MLSKKEKYKVIWSDGVIMEKKKIRSRKIVKYGMAFLIPIICIVIHMIMTSCYPFERILYCLEILIPSIMRFLWNYQAG